MPSATEQFYKEFFTKDPRQSTSSPNVSEARRGDKICKFLSDIAMERQISDQPRLRILDVGCGRGWLTRLASAYGHCDGVDPVADVIAFARQLFPGLNFLAGSMEDVIREATFEPYDVVIASEVIEHVVDQEKFVTDMKKCLTPRGYVILTTPRAELYWLWRRLYFINQPIEDWLTEKEVRLLFERHGFGTLAHNRICEGFPLTFSSSRPWKALQKMRYVRGILQRLLFSLSIYQVRVFRPLTLPLPPP